MLLFFKLLRSTHIFGWLWNACDGFWRYALGCAGAKLWSTDISLAAFRLNNRQEEEDMDIRRNAKKYLRMALTNKGASLSWIFRWGLPEEIQKAFDLMFRPGDYDRVWAFQSQLRLHQKWRIETWWRQKSFNMNNDFVRHAPNLWERRQCERAAPSLLAG